MRVIRPNHHRRTKTRRRKPDIPYSITEAGYEAWLADGNKGSFEDFLQKQSRISNREHLIEEILAELRELKISELKELLEVIRDRNFIS